MQDPERNSDVREAKAKLRLFGLFFVYIGLPDLASCFIGYFLREACKGTIDPADWCALIIALIIILFGVSWLIIKRRKMTIPKITLCLWFIAIILSFPVTELPSNSARIVNIIVYLCIAAGPVIGIIKLICRLRKKHDA